MLAPTPVIVLIRHAQASLGSADYDRLSPLGHRQARLLARRLADEHGSMAIRVRGEHRRHRETLAAVAPHRSRIDRDLNEYRVDALLRAARDDAARLGIDLPDRAAARDPVGHLRDFLDAFPQVLAAWQQGHLDCPENGPWQRFEQRVGEAGQRLQSLAARHGRVLAVTSAGVISTLAATLLERDLVWQRRCNVTLYNAAVTELWRDADGRWQAGCINCIAHLPDRHMHSLA